MNRTQQIIYDILYSEEEQLTFDLSEMECYIEDYPDFTDSIIKKANKGDVYIMADNFIISHINGLDSVQWEVRVKRK